MSIPEITDPPAVVPQRTKQTNDAFVSAWDDFLAWLFGFVPEMQVVVAWIAEQLGLAEAAKLDAQNAVPFATWTALAATTGMGAGDRATVIASDTGTHTDPVVGGTVANAGIYTYSALPAGWQRIASLDSALAAAQVTLATAEKVAAQDAAGIAAGAANFQGTYDAGTLYAIGESVNYLGGVFLKLTTAAAGTTPVDGVDWLELSDILKPNVAQAIKTDTATTTSATFVATGLSVTITTQDAASKVFLQFDGFFSGPNGATPGQGFFRLTRASSVLTQGDAAGSRTRTHGSVRVENGAALSPISLSFLDTPGSAGAHTYVVEWALSAGTAIFLNRSGTDTDASSAPRGASTLIALEVLP